MKLDFIKTDDLKVTASNMRHERKKPDVSDILPSIQKHGILLPLLVRPNCEGFEIVAGRRRYFAGLESALAEMPCAILEDGDDADALEASLIENTMRLAPQPLQQFETFSKLVALGRTPEQIAETFNLPVKSVKQRLAIGGLDPAIRKLIREGKLRDDGIRALTLASPVKQKEYLALVKKGQAPQDWQLRRWVLAKGEYRVEYALFDKAAYTGPIVNDLFGEVEVFTDGEMFWTLQNEAVAKLAEGYQEKGWNVVVMERGDRFHSWDHEKTAKKNGGRVYIEVSASGEVEAHEGYLTEAEAKRLRKAQEKGAGGDDAQGGEATDQPMAARAEISASLQNYVNAHRAEAVKAGMIDHPKVAFRYAVAVLAFGNANVRIDADRIRYIIDDETTASVEASAAAKRYAAHRAKITEKHGIDLERTTDRTEAALGLFAKLLDMTDTQVMQVLAIVMAEKLQSDNGEIDVLGTLFEIDMADNWTPDDAFFDQLRDKRVIGAMLAEVGGKKVADANSTSTGKVMKGIVRDFLTGTNDRQQVSGWVPPYLRFPTANYGTAYNNPAQKSAVEYRKAFAKHRPTKKAKK